MAKVLSSVTVPSVRYEIFPEDKEDNSYIVVRSATIGDMNAIQHISISEKRTITPDGSMVLEGAQYTSADDQCYKAYLLMMDCNLESTPGVPLFKFKGDRYDGSHESFKGDWGRMPVEWADLLSKYIVKANPQLDPKA